MIQAPFWILDTIGKMLVSIDAKMTMILGYCVMSGLAIAIMSVSLYRAHVKLDRLVELFEEESAQIEDEYFNRP